MLQRNADSNNYQPSVARTRIKSRALAKGRREAELRLRTLSSAAVEEADDRTISSKKPVDRKCYCAETDDNGQPKIHHEICFFADFALFKHVVERPPVCWNPVRQSTWRIKHPFDADEDFSRKKHDSQKDDPAGNGT